MRPRLWCIGPVVSPAGVCLAAVLTGAAACGPSVEPPSTPVTLRIGHQLPSSEAMGAGVISSFLIYRQLLTTDRDGRQQPDLARAWEWSPDGLSLALELDAAHRFSDGTEVSAALVKESLERTRASALERFPLLADIARVETRGPSTLILRLDSPSALLVENLDFRISRLAPDGETELGHGPFHLDSQGADEVVLRPNPYYPADTAIGAVRLRRYSSARTAWTAMLRGEIDFLFQIPDNTREFFQANTGPVVFPTLRNHILTLWLNPARPALRSPAVRAALGFAVNRKEIVRLALRGHGVPAQGFLWPEHWAYAEELPVYRHDAQRARQLLLAAARPPSLSGRPSLLRFTCLVAADLGVYQQTAIVLQKQFFDVGIDMQIDVVPPSEFVERERRGDYDALLVDVSAVPSLVRLYTFWYSRSAGFLNSGYTSADAALERLRRARTRPEARAAAVEVQRVFYEDPPAVFLCWPEIARAVSRRFRVPARPVDLLRTVGEWQVAEAPRPPA